MRLEGRGPRAHLAAALLFLLAVPLAAHLAFSPLGHNPTDEGFILAYARRVLDGEVPHLDFISVRPAGSAYLHAPVVAFGGESTFLLSRLVVLVEMAAIAWAWTSLAARAARLDLPPARRFAFALVAFAFTLHTFPLMAWHTIDGLLALSLGALLVLDERPGRRLAGHALVGAALLFKQNYALAIPAVLLLTGDWRRPARVAAALAPGAAYALFLLLAGALPDGLLQMRSLSGELFAVGVSPYPLVSALPWGILVGGLALWLASGRGAPPALRLREDAQRHAGLLLGLLLVAGAAALLPTSRFVRVASFALFGAAFAAAAWSFATGRRDVARLSALALLAAWLASLSFGYNFPALGAGALAVAFLAALLVARGDAPAPHARRRRDAALGALVVVVVAAFVAGRLVHVYAEPPASELVHPLGEVLAGGEGIRTSAGTHAYLGDLQDAVALAGPGRYAILPDVPGHWVRAEQPNPLPIDWPLDLELNKPALLERVTDSLDAQRGNLTVIVAKVKAQRLAEGFHPLGEGENRVVDHVRGSWEKVDQTQLFELYR